MTPDPMGHPHTAFISADPTTDDTGILPLWIEPGDLPLPSQTVDRLREAIAAGKAIAVMASDPAMLTRATLAVAFACDVMPPDCDMPAGQA